MRRKEEERAAKNKQKNAEANRREEQCAADIQRKQEKEEGAVSLNPSELINQIESFILQELRHEGGTEVCIPCCCQG